MICDGCGSTVPLGEVSFILDLGHECRYCPDCLSVYDSWMASVVAMEARLQAELDAWQREARGKLALHLVPTDLPVVRRRPQSVPIVLG